MEKFINLMQLIPVIAAAVKNVESLIPQGGNGKEKLDAVVNSVLAISADLVGLEQQIRKIASTTVALFNAVGVFKTAGRK